MKSRFSFLAFLALLAIPAICQGQGVRYDDVALLDTGRPVQGATITVCGSGSTGTPCTPTTSIFSDSTLSTPITQPGFQSGAQGNFFFYAACGKYDISFTGNGLTGRTKKDVQLGPCGKFNATLKRVTANQGTALSTGNIALAAGWGSTASVTALAGTDGAFRFIVTPNGTGIAANPSITITYVDGTWTNDPICQITTWNPSTFAPSWGIGGGSNATQLVVITNASAGFTPTSGVGVGLMVTCTGR